MEDKKGGTFHHPEGQHKFQHNMSARHGVGGVAGAKGKEVEKCLIAVKLLLLFTLFTRCNSISATAGFTFNFFFFLFFYDAAPSRPII